MNEKARESGDLTPENEGPQEGAVAQEGDAAAQVTNLPAIPGQLDKYVASFQRSVELCNEKFDRFADYIAPRNTDEDMAPENVARGPIIFGMTMLLVVFGVFGLWGLLAPIDSAAIAQGRVSLDSNKKVIDHLEGGIVKEILVAEGDFVKSGQLLVRLDDTAPKARVQLYKGQFTTALASLARLEAERDNKDEVAFPAILTDKEKSDPEIATILDTQRRLFAARKEAVEGKTDVLSQKIKQHDEEINGLNEQIDSANKQLSLLNEEIRDVDFLLKKGNAPKSRLLALERRYAEIKGQKGENLAMISRVSQSINETKIEMFNLKTEMLNKVVDELRETQSKVSDLEEQLRTSEDIARRVEIKAPIDGKVQALAVHTIGGVVRPGEPVMEIIPQDDKLIIEARVRPQDIDVVRAGLVARVRLLAYKVRNVRLVEGTVVNVSGDRFDDERTGESYFVARIEIDDEQLKELEHVELSPGMPAEVLIVTGSRSFFAYMLQPIGDSFNRSFREE